MKLFKYFSSSSPTKIYPLSLFSFLSHASFVQSRYKKKRVCPGLRSGTNSFCTSTHTFRSLHRFSSSSSKASPNLLLHPGALSLAKEEEKERDTARARAQQQKERIVTSFRVNLRRRRAGGVSHRRRRFSRVWSERFSRFGQRFRRNVESVQTYDSRAPTSLARVSRDVVERSWDRRHLETVSAAKESHTAAN